MLEKNIISTQSKYSDMNTKELILELFKQDVDAIYRKQEEISYSIYKKLKVQRSQSAISKALKKVENRVIIYNGTKYHIIKIEEGYTLYKKSHIENEAIHNFAEKEVFESYDVYIINEKILSYTIKAKYHEYVKDFIVKLCDENSIFDIISHGNKMYFLLLSESNTYKSLCKLPNKVKKIVEDNKKKTMAGTFC